MKQGVEGILATITQSRSTNTRRHKVVIGDDGSATAETDRERLNSPAIRSTNWLRFKEANYKMNSGVESEAPTFAVCGNDRL